MENKINIQAHLRFKDDSGNNYPDWEEKKFGEIFSFRVTNSYSRENLNYEGGDVKNIHYGDIHTKFKSHFHLTKEDVPFINREIGLKKISEDNYCKEGDLVIADASEDYEDVGKCIELISLNKEKVLAGLHTILARPDLFKITLGFTGHLMQSEKVRLQIKTIAQGSKVLSISANRLSNINLALPCIEEQKKIADFLSAVDEKIENLQKELDELKAYKKGVMQAIFNEDNTHIAMGGGKSLVVNRLGNLRFKDSFGNEFPFWEKKKLGEITEITSGGTPNRTNKEFWGGDIPWVSTSLIDFNVIVKSDEFITAKGLKNSSAKLYPKGTLLMAMYGQGKTRGKVAILGIDATTNQACAAIIPNQRILNGNFLFQNLSGRYEEIRKLSNAGGQENLSGELLKSISIGIPCLEEQKQIADFLMALDSKINCSKIEIENTNDYKYGLLQKMFI